MAKIKSRYGLVCQTFSEEIRFRTITRKRMLSLGEEQQKETIRELYNHNLKKLVQAFAYCRQHEIGLFRISSNLLPFMDHELGHDLMRREFAPALQAVGEQAADLRLVIHPDQFTVLNSDSPEVIRNSIAFLAAQAELLDLLGQPRSSWTPLEIHGGKSDRSQRLVEVIDGLAEPIRSRLVLENDEKCYSAAQILEVCRATGVPMVFDAHHHIVREKLDSYDHPSVAEMLAAARSTWPDPDWQLVHISNGRAHFQDMAHSDLIHVMPACYREAPWIEVEAKHKELAIQGLCDF
ncbi:MAG: UV DNA damage repair endonuclease UvsE [Candidatus Eremiobacteraeota bacterium]|nr:UV DNA damage repair endonuclease UvsE [Candidatus Eremiobacteraeota bacterium]